MAMHHVIRDLPQHDRNMVEWLRQESHHVFQLHRVKGLVQGLVTNADLLIIMQPDDTDAFPLQVEMNQVGARKKQILVQVQEEK